MNNILDTADAVAQIVQQAEMTASPEEKIKALIEVPGLHGHRAYKDGREALWGPTFLQSKLISNSRIISFLKKNSIDSITRSVR